MGKLRGQVLQLAERGEDVTSLHVAEVSAEALVIANEVKVVVFEHQIVLPGILSVRSKHQRCRRRREIASLKVDRQCIFDRADHELRRLAQPEGVRQGIPALYGHDVVEARLCGSSDALVEDHHEPVPQLHVLCPSADQEGVFETNGQLRTGDVWIFVDADDEIEELSEKQGIRAAFERQHLVQERCLFLQGREQVGRCEDPSFDHPDDLQADSIVRFLDQRR